MSILRTITPGGYPHPQINTHVHHTHKFPPCNVDRWRAIPTPPQHQAYRKGRHEEGPREAESRPATEHKITTCKARPHHPRSITLLHANYSAYDSTEALRYATNAHLGHGRRFKGSRVHCNGPYITRSTYRSSAT
jgi:hypothetical protein